MGGEQDLIDHGTGGGKLCLDFANTVDWHSSDKPEETLLGYSDLVEWSRRQGLITAGDAKSLNEKARRQSGLGESVMKEAVALRESIYKIFSANAHERTPDQRDLRVLNQHLSRGMSHTKITVDGGRFSWGWSDEERPSDMMLWPIAKSAADLLTSGELDKVKECANEEEGCGWVFLDTSRSQTRVWCSMKSCGNRAKFRRFYKAHADERKGGGE